jgi:hypothetical protein
METPRYFLDPEYANVNNPEGFALNTGTILRLGDVEAILDSIGHPLHELLIRYMECDAPYFSGDSESANALYRLPGYDVFFETHFKELPAIAVREGVTEDELPVTTIVAFRRDANGTTYNDHGRTLNPAWFAPFRDQV